MSDPDAPSGIGSAGITYGLPSSVLGVRVCLWLQGCLWAAIALLALSGITGTWSAAVEAFAAAGLAVASTSLGARIAAGRLRVWVSLVLLEASIGALTLLGALFNARALATPGGDEAVAATLSAAVYLLATALAAVIFMNLLRRPVQDYVRD